MAKKANKPEELKIERPRKAKLATKESMKRMTAFPRRRQHFIATVRENKN